MEDKITFLVEVNIHKIHTFTKFIIFSRKESNMTEWLNWTKLNWILWILLTASYSSFTSECSQWALLTRAMLSMMGEREKQHSFLKFFYSSYLFKISQFSVRGRLEGALKGAFQSKCKFILMAAKGKFCSWLGTTFLFSRIAMCYLLEISSICSAQMCNTVILKYINLLLNVR